MEETLAKTEDIYTDVNFQERYDLIKENLAEIIGEETLIEKLKRNISLKLYWGTSPTGKPHIAYFLPLIKITQFTKANCEVTILLADLHAYLDSMKSTWELLDLRTKYYEEIIKQILLLLGADMTKIKFVRGTDYQLSKEYTIDVYKFMNCITINAAQKGGSEVIKQSNNPLMSGLSYPLLQVLDEVYLCVDGELGGLDQMKIFTLSRDHIHKLGYSPVIHLMNPMLPSITANLSANLDSDEQKDLIQPEQIDKYMEQVSKLKNKKLSWENFIEITGKIGTDLEKKHSKKKSNPNKMSSSDASSKIEFTEQPETIRKKISKAFLEPKNTTNSGIFLLLKYIIFPINKLKSVENFTINYNDVSFCYNDLNAIKLDYEADIITPQILKLGISNWMIDFLAPIREYFEQDELKKLVSDAYGA